MPSSDATCCVEHIVLARSACQSIGTYDANHRLMAGLAGGAVAGVSPTTSPARWRPKLRFVQVTPEPADGDTDSRPGGPGAKLLARPTINPGCVAADSPGDQRHYERDRV